MGWWCCQECRRTAQRRAAAQHLTSATPIQKFGEHPEITADQTTQATSQIREGPVDVRNFDDRHPNTAWPATQQQNTAGRETFKLRWPLSKCKKLKALRPPAHVKGGRPTRTSQILHDRSLQRIGVARTSLQDEAYVAGSWRLSGVWRTMTPRLCRSTRHPVWHRGSTSARG